LELARENAARLGLSDRVQFAKSNLLAEVDGSFDLIIANLPYIAAQDRHLLSREVLHDPEVALFAGAQGDELIRALIEQAPPHLRPGGLLALELGLRDYLDKNGFRELVVGVSGGIDSALTVALAVEALGPERVHAVSMPSRFSRRPAWPVSGKS